MTTPGNTIMQAAENRQFERIALLALAQHIFDHQLDVPHSMAVDRTGITGDSMVVSVHDDAADAWVASIAVDSTTTVPLPEPNVFGGPMDRHVVAGRLPDMGIRVTVRYYQPVTVATPAARLQVVS